VPRIVPYLPNRRSRSKGSRKIADVSGATQVGTTYKVTWVDVPDRLATTTSVRKQFATGEVTGGRKLEGAYWGDGGAYFVASFARTSDGSKNEHDGQVWFYDPGNQTVTLKSIFGVNMDPDADTDYDGPDNIALDPNGGLILAEDGEGIQHLVGVTTDGKSHLPARPQRRQRQRVCRTDLHRGRRGAVRLHPGRRLHLRDHPWK
jgi:uncharacterized protein